MAELHLVSPAVVAVLASIEACDRAAASHGAIAMRIAPREVLLVGEVDEAATRSVVRDPAAIVDDVSDAWAGFVLEGGDARQAFARLSELELPPAGWVQGELARAPAKVIVEPGRLTILVPAMLSAHVEERIRVDAAEIVTS